MERPGKVYPMKDTYAERTVSTPNTYQTSSTCVVNNDVSVYGRSSTNSSSNVIKTNNNNNNSNSSNNSNSNNNYNGSNYGNGNGNNNNNGSYTNNSSHNNNNNNSSSNRRQEYDNDVIIIENKNPKNKFAQFDYHDDSKNEYLPENRNKPISVINDNNKNGNSFNHSDRYNDNNNCHNNDTNNYNSSNSNSNSSNNNNSSSHHNHLSNSISDSGFRPKIPQYGTSTNSTQSPAGKKKIRKYKTKKKK